MKMSDLCSRNVATVEAGASLREAALEMRNRHVGALVVVERGPDGPRPVGMLTDRDIVVAVIAVPGARPEGIRAGDVMGQPVAVARETDGLYEVLQAMGRHGVRRLPVVSDAGVLCGIVSADDVLREVAAGLGKLAEALAQGAARESAARAALHVKAS
jgi:CBS domain-containing protein